MSKIHRIAGLRISRVGHQNVTDPLQDYWTPKDALPDLEPPEEKLRRNSRHIFSSDRITLSHSSSMEDVFDPDMHPEHHNTVARMTVYVMNLIVMVMALPVGLALLAFNILFGENFRTTAHVIALTGMAMALTTMPGNEDLLRFL